MASPTKVIEVVEIISGLMGWSGGVCDEPDTKGDITGQWMSIGLAEDELGWSPETPLEEGVEI